MTHPPGNPPGSTPGSTPGNNPRKTPAPPPGTAPGTAPGKTPVAIVTGAGSGIGRETAKLLALAGYHTVLVSRTLKNLQKTASLIEGPSTIHPTDLSCRSNCQQVIEQTLARLGRIDALANVAGCAPSVTIENITAELWQKNIDTNLSAIVHLTSAAWPTFKQQQQGIIVNVSSLASIDPFPGFSIYGAAKAGVNLFTLVTAREGASQGIKAVTIAPGAVETGMLRALFDESVIPADKTLRPQDIGQLICDCITGHKTFEPGEVITVPNEG